MRPVPDALLDRAFTVAQAAEIGVTGRQLQGSRFVRIHAGVYRVATSEPTVELLADAALLALGPGHAISHLTNLRLRGMTHGPLEPIHVASTRRTQVRRNGVQVHRYRGDLPVVLVDGRPLLTVERTFVDLGTVVGDRSLLAVGDHLVSEGLTTPLELQDFADRVHIDGVLRARRVARHVRPGAASVRESEVRWTVVGCGLPEPEINVDIHDDRGGWLARGDLVLRAWKILIEYDGWQHERDAQQRQWDHLRREQLEAAGWTVIVITTKDMARPRLVSLRIHQALKRRGYDGPGPRFARPHTFTPRQSVRARANLALG